MCQHIRQICLGLTIVFVDLFRCRTDNHLCLILCFLNHRRRLLLGLRHDIVGLILCRHHHLVGLIRRLLRRIRSLLIGSRHHLICLLIGLLHDLFFINLLIHLLGCLLNQGLCLILGIRKDRILLVQNLAVSCHLVRDHIAQLFDQRIDSLPVHQNIILGKGFVFAGFEKIFNLINLAFDLVAAHSRLCLPLYRFFCQFSGLSSFL